MRPMRRRRGLSADGSVPGIHYNRRTPGLSGRMPDPFSAESLARQAPEHFPDYDPARREYESGGPDYQQPESWWMNPPKTIPEELWHRPPAAPRASPPEYAASMLSQEMFEQLMHESPPDQVLPSSPELEAREPANPGAASDSQLRQREHGQAADETRPARLRASDDGLPMPEAQPDTQPLPDTTPASEDPPDLISLVNAAYEQQMNEGLERLVREPTPEPEPDPFEEEKRMYDQQLQQMMDPFGPGPFGPMM